MTSHTIYQSYLLRLWRTDSDAPWRASLQSTADGEPIIFSNTAALFAFLQERLAQSTPEDEAQSKQENPGVS